MCVCVCVCASELIGDTVEAEKVKQELRGKKDAPPPSSDADTSNHIATATPANSETAV